MVNLIFLGPPGSGKGTQAQLLSKKMNIPHISTGDIFRENIAQLTEIGKLAKSFIDDGQLVPDEVTNTMVQERLKRQDAQKGYILDGFPRNIAQAKFLAEISTVESAINFVLDDSIVVKRISGRRSCPACKATFHSEYNAPKKENVCDSCGNALRQRSDETQEVVQERLKVYHEKTAPLVEYYKKLGILANIDASQSIQDIHEQVMKILK